MNGPVTKSEETEIATTYLGILENYAVLQTRKGYLSQKYGSLTH